MDPEGWCSEWEPAEEAPPSTVASQEPQPEPVRRWIVDRVPTAEDVDRDGEVVISARIDAPEYFHDSLCYTPWFHVHPGTPWAPVGAIPNKPFDPTTLDRNGLTPPEEEYGVVSAGGCVPADVPYRVGDGTRERLYPRP